MSCTAGCSFCTTGSVSLPHDRLPWLGGRERGLGRDVDWEFARGVLHPTGEAAEASGEELPNFVWVPHLVDALAPHPDAAQPVPAMVSVGRVFEEAARQAQLRQSGVQSLIYRYRDLGHLLACTDPLNPCPLSQSKGMVGDPL